MFLIKKSVYLKGEKKFKGGGGKEGREKKLTYYIYEELTIINGPFYWQEIFF